MNYPSVSCRREPADWRLFDAADKTYLFVVNGSQIYQANREVKEALEHLDSTDEAAVRTAMQGFGLPVKPIDDSAPASMPLRSLSLALAQKCNLGCTYCYAQEGAFGGAPKAMSNEVALQAVDTLFRNAAPGERVHLSFLGGEPLMNRPVLRKATQYASAVASQRGVHVGFSITTNGTLVTDDDGEFFEEHGFAVSVSLDGVGESHDRLRSFKNGVPSFDRILSNIKPLLARQRAMQVSARVTVTPQNLDLTETLDGLIQLGFHSVGFSPMLASPTGREQMEHGHLELMLHEMIACGTKFENAVLSTQRYPFSNMVTAMRELHKGSFRPYPCGAGAAYLGVSADGELSACHRFVDDSSGAMGNLSDGVDPASQRRWLQDRHVMRQEPCKTCWARYLCGGGCHHEVIHRGRPACDYIKGWLHYCLQSYARLLEKRPEYFSAQPVSVIEEPSAVLSEQP